MARFLLFGALACFCSGLVAQDARLFQELSKGGPGCPRVNDTSAGAHRLSGTRPLKDAATDEVIAKGARRSAAAFGVTDLEGKLQTVGDQKGHIVAIGFWSTRCEPSMKMLQEFRNFQKQAAERGMKIVLWPVHFESWAEIQSFLRVKEAYFHGVQVKRLGLGEHGLSQLVDELDSLPTIFLIDKEGRIAATWSGFQENLLLARVNRLLGER
jgi:thiol-disulfide isomerase/thioredoxin